MDFDSKYEFNAPKYIDFLQGDVDEDSDKWFDERDGDEGGIDIDMVPYFEKHLEGGNGFQNATAAISAALKDNEVQANKSKEEKREEKQQDVEMDIVNEDTIEPVVKNEIASPPKLVIKNEIAFPQKPVMKSEEPTITANVQTNQSTKPNVRKTNIVTSWTDSTSGTNATPLVKRNMLRRSCNNKSIVYSDSKKRKKTISEEGVVFSSKKHKPEVKLCNPETPSFVRKLRERGKKRGQSSEMMQLNKIKEMQRQTRENVRKNERKMKQALKAGSYVPAKSLEVTRPVEFQFESDKRLKNHGMKTRSDESKPFQNQLRQHPPSPTFKKEPTKVKPFNFTLPDKSTSALPDKKWESMAQFTMNYQTKTPERFRAKPKKGEANNLLNGGEKKHQAAPQLTTAKTPQLMTKKRTRTSTVESSQEQEDKIVEEMKKYQFKATEFNPKIVEKQGMYGVKKIPETSKTEPKPFRFEIDARLEQRKHKNDEEEIQTQCGKKNSKADMSQSGKAERPRITEVKPFSFESRDKERYNKKEEKIKEIIQKEEKMHECHARPLPSFSPDVLPVVPTKEHTKPEPFKISSGSVAYQNKFQKQLCELDEQKKANRQFKAKEQTVTKKDPFKPVLGLLPPTNVQEFNLNSEVRAKERAKFDDWKHEQELRMEEEKIRFEKSKELEEELKIKQLRKEAVPKANPIRHFKPMEIQKSAKALTTPHTPNFECPKRSKR